MSIELTSAQRTLAVGGSQTCDRFALAISTSSESESTAITGPRRASSMVSPPIPQQRSNTKPSPNHDDFSLATCQGVDCCNDRRVTSQLPGPNFLLARLAKSTFKPGSAESRDGPFAFDDMVARIVRDLAINRTTTGFDTRTGFGLDDVSINDHRSVCSSQKQRSSRKCSYASETLRF